jgi:type IV pilus assembly protein PilC
MGGGKQRLMGLPPTIQKLEKKKGKSTGARELEIPFLPSIPQKLVIEFTRNLAVMLKARLTLLKCLDTAIQQTTHARFLEILKDIRSNVKRGKSLSQAIAKHPKVFDTVFIQLTKVGELSGNLEDVLLRMSKYQEKAYKLKQSIRMALVYPAIIITVAVAAVSFLLVFVVPTFVDMYRDFEAELPAPTLLILTVSDFLTNYLLWILGGVIAIGFFIRNYAKTDKGKAFIDRAKLKIPYFGEMYRKGLISQFSDTLSTLLSSGVTLTDSLKVLKDSSQNVVLQQEVSNLLSSIKKGRSIKKSLSKSTIFPLMVTQMISVGEETASLDEMLKQVAVLFEEELDMMVEGLTSVIEPVLIVFIGLIIGVIIVALYLPIFEMVNVIG